MEFDKKKLQVNKQDKQVFRRQQCKDLRSKYTMTSEASEIVNLDWNTLVERLQSRELTAVQVLQAYVAKSLDVTTFSNAVTEYYLKSFEMAEELDKLPQVKGPLHGIPFCVKDDTDIQGMDTTIGLAKNCFQPKEKTAAIVSTLMELGAVPFCKTNVCQACLNFGSDNPIYGETTSSHNQKLGPGGSSSGTGALVGGMGAIFGTGSDVGGSLRIPAHFNGTASLMPTCGRMRKQSSPYLMKYPCFQWKEISTTTEEYAELVPGIFGRDAHTVSEVYKHLLTDNVQTKFDLLLAPIPWNGELHGSKKKLRIGYFTQLPDFPPVGDTVEVLENAGKALESLGHTVVPVAMPGGYRMGRCILNFLYADEFREIKSLWKGEDIAGCVKLTWLLTKVPPWLKRFAASLMNYKYLSALYQPTLVPVLDSGASKSFELWNNIGEQNKIREEILAMWEKLELDCLICPVMPFPAPPLRLAENLTAGAIYVLIWNLVKFPAGVVRFGRESGKNIDKFDTRGDWIFKLAQKGCRESIGSPIGVQVVGLPFKEELVLRVMEELDDYAIQNKCCDQQS